jgi:hypothetical protein
MSLQQVTRDDAGTEAGAVRALPALGSTPSPEVVALLAQVQRIRTGALPVMTDPEVGCDPPSLSGAEAVPEAHVAEAEMASEAQPAQPAPELQETPEGQGIPEAGGAERISWLRAVALLALGCLALAVAACCVALAAGFTVAAVLEPRDVLVAAREALCGMVLLGAGVSAGLAWCLVAAVGAEPAGDVAVQSRRTVFLRRLEASTR